MRPRAVLVLALCLVVAGCQSPVGPPPPAADPATETTTPGATTAPSPTTTATREPTTATTDGFVVEQTSNPDVPVYTARPDALSANASRVLDRVEELYGVDATEPVAVEPFAPDDPAVRNRTPRDVADSVAGLRESTAMALQLYSNETAVPTTPFGYSGPSTVHVMNDTWLGVVSNYSQEAVLAHEFVHVLQHQSGIEPTLDSRDALPETTDAILAHNMRGEGDASVYTQAYRDRYLPDAAVSVADRNRTGSRATWSRRVARLVYYEGYRDLRDRNLTPTERGRLFRAWPATTAGVIYGTPDEPRGTLDPPTVPGYEANGTNRVGALVLRYAVRVNADSYATADDAVRGWQNDQVVTYRSDAGNATLLRTTWADRSEAAEFAAAFGRVLDARNATERDGLTVVPGTEHAPRMHYVVRQDGATVTVVASRTPAATRDVADATAG